MRNCGLVINFVYFIIFRFFLILGVFFDFLLFFLKKICFFLEFCHFSHFLILFFSHFPSKFLLFLLAILQMNDLSSLSLTKNSALSSDLGCKYISNFITLQKNLSELDLSDANLTNSQAKSLADGLMRAKQLISLNLSNNASIGYAGMASILYNLAFSPKLQYLNIKGGVYTGGFPQIVESLYKLLRISGSLEVINLSGSKDLNPSLNKEFFVSLGEIKTLRVLDLSWSGVFNDNLLKMLGKAIAFNAKKEGVLEVLNIEGCVNNYQGVKNLANSLNISEVEHEEWYGDSSKVGKMSGTDFQKKYFNNLRVLNFAFGRSLGSLFNLAIWK